MLHWLLSPADLSMGARLITGLPRVLRHPIRIEAARATLRRRLERREADFLDLVWWGVYANPSNPYGDLLRLAGCEYGDLERLLSQDGLEGALGRLYAQGVYLTVDELKGRRAAIRGAAAIQVDPQRLFSPRLAPHLLSQTSGSRGARSVIPISLPAILDRALDLALILDAHRARDWRLACWGVPGGSALAQVLGPRPTTSWSRRKGRKASPSSGSSCTPGSAPSTPNPWPRPSCPRSAAGREASA